MLDKRNFYINGKWVKPLKTNDLEVINPSSEEPFAVISLGSKDDTDSAVKAAKKAFDKWKETSKEERIKLLEKLLTIYKKRSKEMSEAISMEMGSPIDYSSSTHTTSGQSHLEDFILRLKEFNFEEHFDSKSNNHISYEPIGVCGLITPWNWPINQIALKVIPAFAAGCTMVLKPSEIAPISGMLFAEMIDEAGFPSGVFNLVNGDGAGVGTNISSHPDIDMISFTGSTRAGKLISKNAADTIKRVCLELGGKGGNIVFADSYPNAVRDGIRNVMSNSGQSCDAPTRMLVEKSIYEKAIKEAANEANKIKVDIASKKGDHIGPVVSKVQYDKIINLIKSGIDEGATLATGGPELPNNLNKGYFIKPTIFTNVTNDMEIAKKEIFGPVLSIIPFETEEEAIKITNDTEYGLGNYLQTEDKKKAKRVAKKLRSGIVYINGKAADSGTPFGGYRQSGNGREGGTWGLEEGGKLRRYAHIGTGNYNPATARVYTDFGLLTSHRQITRDIADIFNRMTGFARPPRYRSLLVAPHHMRKHLLKRIRRETKHAKKGEPASMLFKCNALTDPEIIDTLYEASRAGVQIDLLVRGVCCLVPGVPDQSQTIRVRSVVGRFLEHSRAYWFENGGKHELYIGSADLMQRNLDRRVEVLTPVVDPDIARTIRTRILDLYLEDCERSRVLQSDGEYVRLRGDEPGLDVQESLLEAKRR